MQAAIEYIKSFLLYGNEEAAKQIGYTADEQEWQQYKVVIVPQRAELTDLYMPSLNEKSKAEKVGNTWVIRKDIIYNTFFLISRAEELLNPQRDKHGRFLAKYSILSKENNLLTPIVDEYSRMLMKMLQLPLPEEGIKCINLTHDVDTIGFYRHPRGMVGGILRGRIISVIRALSSLRKDPAYTFPWILEQERPYKHDPRVKQIFFFKASNGKGYDYPQYLLHSPDFGFLLKLLEPEKVQYGLHSSYQSGTNYSLISKELNTLREVLSQPTLSINRNHFLRSTEPEHLRVMETIGITDDYSMAFPDQAGFRLGTSRPVRWIDPRTGQLTSLVLHPLTIMDGTLSDSRYMNLTEDEAYYYSQQLIDKTRQHGGELTLLWHNNTFAHHNYHRRLYSSLLKYIFE